MPANRSEPRKFRPLFPRRYWALGLVVAVVVAIAILASTRGESTDTDQFETKIAALGYDMATLRIEKESVGDIAGRKATAQITYGQGATCNVVLAAHGSEIVVNQIGPDDKYKPADLLNQGGIEDLTSPTRAELAQFLQKVLPQGC